jgi:hypothetical protein
MTGGLIHKFHRLAQIFPDGNFYRKDAKKKKILPQKTQRTQKKRFTTKDAKKEKVFNWR